MTHVDLRKALNDSDISYQHKTTEGGQPWYITNNMRFGMNSAGEDGEVNSLIVVSDKYGTSLGGKLVVSS